MENNVLIEDDNSIYEIDSECFKNLKKGQRSNKRTVEEQNSSEKKT